MLLLFLHWLQSIDIAIPHVFFYTTFRMLMAAITSFTLTLAVGKVFIAKLVSMKVGHRVRVAEVTALAGTYSKGAEIPSMGGILFLFSMILSNLLWMDIKSPYTILFSFTLLSMGSIGFLDDYCKMKKIGISARFKLGLIFIFFRWLFKYFFSCGNA